MISKGKKYLCNARNWLLNGPRDPWNEPPDVPWRKDNELQINNEEKKVPFRSETNKWWDYTIAISANINKLVKRVQKTFNAYLNVPECDQRRQTKTLRHFSNGYLSAGQTKCKYFWKVEGSKKCLKNDRLWDCSSNKEKVNGERINTVLPTIAKKWQVY